MDLIKKLTVAILVILPGVLMGMGDPDDQPLNPEEMAQRRMTDYVQRQAKEGTPEQRAFRAMQDYKVTPEEKAAIALEAHAALQELDAQHLTQILAEVKRETDQAKREEFEAKEASLKWENTLLTPANWKFGWYNRDFVEAGFIGAGIVADVMLYQQLLKRRLDVVLQSLKTDYNAFIKIIKAVNTAEEKYEEQYEEKSALGKLFTNDKNNRAALVAPMKKYIADKHKYVGFWGLSKTTLVPLLLRWGFDKVSDFLENSIISNDAYKPYHMFKKLIATDGRRPTEWRAFQRTDRGDLVPAEKTPFSFINIARLVQWMYNPTYVMAKMGAPNFVQRIKFMSTIGGVQIPKFLLSEATQLGIEIIGLGFAAKNFDAMNSLMWSDYCTAHREALLSALEDYKTAKENPAMAEQSLAQAEQKLKDFVHAGHEKKSWLPGAFLRQWWTSRASGEAWIPTWTTVGLAAVLGVKAYMWYKKSSQQEEGAPQGQPTA